MKKVPWEEISCKDSEYTICISSEKQSICRKVSVVYEHICMECKLKGKKASYIGQTSRSSKERALEHYKEEDHDKQESHVVTHNNSEHEDIIEQGGTVSYKWEIKQVCRTTFERKVSEAVRIKLARLNGQTVLNSRDEFGSFEFPDIEITGPRSSEIKTYADQELKNNQFNLDGLTLVDENITRDTNDVPDQYVTPDDDNIKSETVNSVVDEIFLDVAKIETVNNDVHN